MRCGVFPCPDRWREWLPPGTLRPAGGEVGRIPWDLLALTPEGCGCLTESRLRCRILLAPGGCRIPEGAGTVVTCGLSPRDSLTLSSLAEPVLCIQRALPRLDGSILEPQEVPLPPLPAPAEGLLPLLGLWLLQMPLTNALSHGTLSPKGGERR